LASNEEIKLKKLGDKIFYYLKRVVVIFLLFVTSANSQNNIEAIAKLHSKININKNNWFEGYNSILSGSYSPYQSHRSGSNRDSAYVVRTSGSENLVEWITSEFTITPNSDSLYFLWNCGFGNNLGNEWFDLFIDDEDIISFSTINDLHWSLLGKKGIQLSFTAVHQNSNGANFGYMVLTIPSSYLSEKKSLKIKIQAKTTEKEIWYRLFAYKDALQYLIRNEQKDFYFSIDFIHMGDAELNLCASSKYSNSKIQLFNSDIIIAEGRLKSDGLISESNIFIPRYLQPNNDSVTIIKIDEALIDTIYWNEISKQRLFAFMDEELVCDSYVFPVGDFPEFHWKNEILVENELGKFPINVTYYDKDFHKVSTADKPGRYGAVIEGVTLNGFIIKRYVTLFCSNVEFDDYSNNVPVTINRMTEYGISDEAWKEYSNNSERYSFGSLKYFPKNNPDAAIFLAGLDDIDNYQNKYDSPRIRDRQWWITLKAKLDGKNDITNPLLIPKKIDIRNFPFIKDSIQLESSYSDVQLNKIKNLCADWAKIGETPNVTLIGHKGKIIFYEAFGLEENGKPIYKDSKIWMASITKLLTGVLMMQFVEQGLVDLDDPVSKYFNEFDDNNKLTIRNLFNHTSGLDFAGEWASDWNVSLENQVAQILPLVEVGKHFSYHRVGYALAGKIIEKITGKAVPYLFQENIFSPLSMNTAYSENTYGGLYCTSLDLARLGQMLLNKGTYNGYKLFSQKTFEKMLPEKLNVGDREWGIGTSRMSGNGLSENAFGHGAASGSVFIIDPQKDLIIISARNKPGKSHSDFENLLIKLCTELVNN
jgi:hypothetical protein